MLGERIKELRKQKGYSQETLAQQMNVVRQTVSKWENGTSVPDAEMLKNLAEIFEVPVSVLLGEAYVPEETAGDQAYRDIARQLAILNDQLATQAARRKRRVCRTIVGVILAAILLFVLYVGTNIVYRSMQERDQILTETTIECVLGEEHYFYGVTYDQNYQVIYGGGDAFIANHVQTEQYGDANVLLAQIEDYFTARGGTYTVIEEKIVEE